MSVEQNSFFDAIFHCDCLPYIPINFASTRVGESLSQEIEKWKCYPVLINAPTGAGKSTFIFNDLARFAQRENRQILVLSNRLSLNMQQKEQLCKNFHLPCVGTKVLEDYHVFGNIILSTYQGILPFMSSPMASPGNGVSPMFIVFDEAHFFCSDATFNPWTETILTAIIQRYPLSVRIYMSATPEDVKPAIAAIEKKHFSYIHGLLGRQSISCEEEAFKHNCLFMMSIPYADRAIKEYIFAPDYSHISLFFFSDWSTISNIISGESDPSKWLIFVNRKEDGKKLRNDLTKDIADYIDSSSTNDVIRKLTRRQCFSKKVLISTSVIDNGVSIVDEQLKNIVVDFVDYTELIQMVGRKRIRADESINLYVRVPALEEIEKHRAYLEKLYGTLLSFEASPSYFFKNRWGTLIDSEQDLFAPVQYYNPNDPYNRPFIFGINNFAKYQLALQCGKYEELEDEVSVDSNAYAYKVCEWLQKSYSPEMCIDSSIENKVKEELTNILRSKHSTKISANDEIERLENELKACLPGPILKKLAFKSDNANRSAANIRKILNYFGLPFELTNKKNNFYMLQPKQEASEHQANSEHIKQDMQET